MRTPFQLVTAGLLLASATTAFAATSDLPMIDNLHIGDNFYGYGFDLVKVPSEEEFEIFATLERKGGEINTWHLATQAFKFQGQAVGGAGYGGYLQTFLESYGEGTYTFSMHVCEKETLKPSPKLCNKVSKKFNYGGRPKLPAITNVSFAKDFSTATVKLSENPSAPLRIFYYISLGSGGPVIDAGLTSRKTTKIRSLRKDLEFYGPGKYTLRFSVCEQNATSATDYCSSMEKQINFTTTKKPQGFIR